MNRPRKLIWLAVLAGIGYGLWRWRQSQTADLSAPVVPTARPTPPPTSSVSGSAAAPASAATDGAPKRITTRIHRGAPPSPPRHPAAEEPPPAPSEPPATNEQTLAPLAPEEVVSSHAEPEPPATNEQTLAPLTPEEALASPEPAPAEPVAEAPAEVAAEAHADPLNINTADLQSLIDLPGIGPALATRIIAYRDEKGPFATVEQLIDVPGIGPNNINEFRDKITAE
jgi:competence protein ComEA